MFNLGGAAANKPSMEPAREKFGDWAHVGLRESDTREGIRRLSHMQTVRVWMTVCSIHGRIRENDDDRWTK